MRMFATAVVILVSTTAIARSAPLKVVAFDIEPIELDQTSELKELLAKESAILRQALADKGLEVIDARQRAAEIAAHRPLSECVGCARSIANSLGADIEVTTTIQEIEYPVYNVFASVRDVATNYTLRKAVVSVDGLDPADWTRGVTALVNGRLLAQPLPGDVEGLRAMVARVPAPVE